MSAQPQGQPDAPHEESLGGPSEFFTPTRIKQIVITSIVLLVAAAAFFIWQGVADDAADTKWDEYHALRKEHEPTQDPLWNDPFGVYGAQRDRYTRALENFLQDAAAADGGVLEPQIRWRIARTMADHILSMKDVLDPAKRLPHYERALAHMKVIRDEHPDFPLNWEMFSDKNYPSLTRAFIAWFEANQAWESKYLPSDKAPDGKQTVIFRTNRGDMRLRLYISDAPDWTKDFVARAIAGAYDGTAFIERQEVGDQQSPRESSIHGGSSATRDAQDYQWLPLVDILDVDAGGGRLPEPSRNLIPFTRGIVAAWHDRATTYDSDTELLFVVDRSPQLDYDFTPIGKLIDDASLATLDRIFEGDTWREDPKASEDTAARGVLDAFQVPVVIKKVLVYGEDGALIEPGAGQRLETKAEVDNSEKQLASVVADAYLAEAPARDTGDDDASGDDKSSDEGAEDGDSGDDEDGASDDD